MRLVGKGRNPKETMCTSQSAWIGGNGGVTWRWPVFRLRFRGPSPHCGNGSPSLCRCRPQCCDAGKPCRQHRTAPWSKPEIVVSALGAAAGGPDVVLGVTVNHAHRQRRQGRRGHVKSDGDVFTRSSRRETFSGKLEVRPKITQFSPETKWGMVLQRRIVGRRACVVAIFR